MEVGFRSLGREILSAAWGVAYFYCLEDVNMTSRVADRPFIDFLYLFFVVVVADLKRIYFTNKQPLNDDEIQIQKLCVYLEKALRYGARGRFAIFFFKKFPK